MNFELLHDYLDEYQKFWPEDRPEQTKAYIDFVNSTDRCCLRTHLAGHCTGSAFIVSPDYRRTLLLFHPFLRRWLQPGGHADGNPDLLEVARREAHEETGLRWEDFSAVELATDRVVPLDLDIHDIPARGAEPAHLHYDLRFLLVADPSLQLVPERPEMLLQWIPLNEVEQITDEESVLRLVRKVGWLPSS